VARERETRKKKGAYLRCIHVRIRLAEVGTVHGEEGIADPLALDQSIADEVVDELLVGDPAAAPTHVVIVVVFLVMVMVRRNCGDEE
jgi:hypothetical protein